MRSYLCPVCGYPNLDEPAWDPNTGIPSFNICPSCGCEFGYNDATPQARENHLKNWVKQGAPWFRPELKPHSWNLKKQLEHIGVDLDKLEM